MSFGPSADDKRRAMRRAYSLVYGGGTDRGQSMVDSIISITVGALVIALIGVVGVNAIADINFSANASHSNWSDGATSIFQILDLILVLAFLLLLIGMALTRR